MRPSPNVDLYTVRPYRPDDRPALLDLVGKLWPDLPRAQVEERWWWKFEPVPILLVELAESGELAGLCASLPFRLYTKGQGYPAAWMADLFLLPEHQRRGLGSRLTRGWESRYEVLAALNTNPGSWATFTRLGWGGSHVPLLLSPWPMLLRPFHRLVGLKASRNPLQVHFEEHSRSWQFGKQFDELWSRARDVVAPLAVRDAASLQQRYMRDAKRQYIVLRCIRRGALVGYMILRVLPAGSFKALAAFRIGLVVDYLVDPEEPAAFSRMLDAAALWFAAQGVALMMCMASRSEHQLCLRKRAFVGPTTPLVGAKLGKLAVGYTARVPHVEDLPERRPWYLTLGDSDLDLLWGAE